MRPFRGPRIAALLISIVLSLAPSLAEEKSGCYLSPLLPAQARRGIEAAMASRGIALEARSEEEGAALSVVPEREGGEGEIGAWYFALALPFSSFEERVDAGELEAFLRGGPPPRPLSAVLVDEASAPLAGIFFPAGAAPAATKGEKLLDACRDLPGGAALLPFEALEPRWKSLAVSGTSLLARSADLSRYPLAVRIVAKGRPGLVAELKAALPRGITNRDPELLCSVMMTGTTAMTRVTAKRMDRYGPTYPGLKIAPLLRSADLAHVSNEVSFVEGSETNATAGAILFSSKPSYIELLEYLGVDLVELTGNHLLDFGPKPFLDSLALYARKGMEYFGGGRDAKEASRALVVERNGGRIAFLGACAGPSPSYAGKDSPGPARFDQAGTEARIREARALGLTPVVSVQYFEEYDYAPTAAQRKCFRALIDAGAAIVQGSQAHQPQAFELYGGGFIHYGLGNFIFDQMWSDGTRESLIDEHVFYSGRHIGTAVHAALIEDYAQPRPMSDAERRGLLAKVYASSLMDGKAFRSP